MQRLLTLILFVITFCLYSQPKYFSYEALNIIEYYEDGLAKARTENIPIFLYFTCYGCSSVRQIEEQDILVSK